MVITRDDLKLQVTEQDLTVDRLQIEKRVLLNTVRQEGFELGIRSSSKLSYKEFRHFERVEPIAASLDDDVLDYLWSYLDLKGYPAVGRLQDPDFTNLLEVVPQSRVAFAQGWIDGVITVWQMLKAQGETVQ